MALDILIVKLLFLVTLASSQVASKAAIILAHQDFDRVPTNLTVNQTSQQFVLLDNKTNIISGWSYQGTVWYVIADRKYRSLTGDGNGVQLGPNGMISYAFYCDVNADYFLTFTLAPSSSSCANNATAVNVSDPRFSKVLFYKESLGKETWQTHAYSIWCTNYVTLQIQSVATISHNNTACWPVIDDLLLTGINNDEKHEDNRVLFNSFSNNGFEVGPGFPPLTSQSILLADESSLSTSSSVHLALDPWIVLGTVKYIYRDHYAVPQGRRAVELISASGHPSGIAYNANFLNGIRQYTLEFIMGDTGDLCVGNFTVVVQVGSSKWNFMMKSRGDGSSKKYSVKLPLNRSHSPRDVLPISFISYTETRTSDHQELCGPVLDAMFLGFPSGLRSTRLPGGLSIFGLVVAFIFFA